MDMVPPSMTTEKNEGEHAGRVSAAWSRPIKKTLYTLNINNYAPEICALSYPLMRAYARKIGADFRVLTMRKFPEWPVVYEKLQIHELAKEDSNDWSIFVDSDALINPEMFDVTEHLSKDTVCHNGRDMAGVRWKYDQYFRRDGRHFGSCNWFTVASDWCLDLWRPLDDLTLDQAVANINITMAERNSGVCEASHLIDDYTLSRNIARFGLKTQTVIDLCAKFGWRTQNAQPISPFLYHKYTISNAQKVAEMLSILSTPNGQVGSSGLGWGVMSEDNVKEYKKQWGVPDERPSASSKAHQAQPNIRNSDDVAPGSHIQGWMEGSELKWLFDTAKNLESVVEIGSWKGRSTYALCLSGCKTVYAVDHFLGSSEHQTTFGFRLGWSPYPEFQRNILEHFNNIVLKRSASIDAVRDFADKGVDMVFLDGAREYESVTQDLVAWVPKARGMVSVHGTETESVRRALQDYFGRAPNQVQGSIWVYEANPSETKAGGS